MNRKKEALVNKVPKQIWMLLSFLLAIVLWILISYSAKGSSVFATPIEVIGALLRKGKDGTLWGHIGVSLFRVLAGFGLAFVISIPVAFLMAWYEVFRRLVEPWIQFIRNIPPLAYIPLIILAAGVGEKSKVIVIFIAAFLTLVVTVYQGVCNVDQTLIKAARILGATDKDIFFKIIIPASTPFILVGTRLGLSASLTTLIAAELTGATKGLGMMTRQASSLFELDVMLLGIILIGIIGILFEKVVRFLERELTGWQEKAQ